MVMAKAYAPRKPNFRASQGPDGETTKPVSQRTAAQPTARTLVHRKMGKRVSTDTLKFSLSDGSAARLDTRRP